MKLFILAVLTAALVGCSAGAPAATPAPGPTLPIAVNVEQEPGRASLTVTVATATPEPAADSLFRGNDGSGTALSPAPTRELGAGICYRTPEVQRWIIHRLGIQSCRLITKPELYRITDALEVPAVLKPGDLAGLANVPAVALSGYCRDWTEAAVAAAMLEGLNPAATIGIESDLLFSGEHYQMQLMAPVIYPDGNGNTWSVEQLKADLDERGITNTDAQAEGWHKRAIALKHAVNRRAHAIATAIGEARAGDAGLVRLKSPGVAVIGAEDEPGAVIATVGLRVARDMPECAEEGKDAL